MGLGGRALEVALNCQGACKVRALPKEDLLKRETRRRVEIRRGKRFSWRGRTAESDRYVSSDPAKSITSLNPSKTRFTPVLSPRVLHLPVTEARIIINTKANNHHRMVEGSKAELRFPLIVAIFPQPPVFALR